LRGTTRLGLGYNLSGVFCTKLPAGESLNAWPSLLAT